MKCTAETRHIMYCCWWSTRVTQSFQSISSLLAQLHSTVHSIISVLWWLYPVFEGGQHWSLTVLSCAVSSSQWCIVQWTSNLLLSSITGENAQTMPHSRRFSTTQRHISAATASVGCHTHSQQIENRQYTAQYCSGYYHLPTPLHMASTAVFNKILLSIILGERRELLVTARTVVKQLTERTHARTHPLF